MKHYAYELLHSHGGLPIGTIMIKAEGFHAEYTVVDPRTGDIRGWQYCALASPKRIRRYATELPCIWGGGKKIAGPARKALRSILGGRQVMRTYTVAHGNKYRIVRRLYGQDVYVVQMHYGYQDLAAGCSEGWRDVAPCGSKTRKYKTLKGARAHASAIIKAGGPYAWHCQRRACDIILPGDPSLDSIA